MLCALIMAGGKGKRFWPLSTEEKPKQFLNLLGNLTMIQMTVKRLEALIPKERIFVVTAEKYINLVREQLPDLPLWNIIAEPEGRNTAPCIALSAFIIKKYYDDAVIAVVPSDHLIKEENKFLKTLTAADEFIQKNKQAIVTLGMKPNRPETGYGYIECSKKLDNLSSCEVIKIKSFIEKPSLSKAEEYIKNGGYLWNGGIFIWNVNNILELTKKYIRKTYDKLSEIAASSEENFNEVLSQKYREIESISVDYAIMENADEIYVIPCNFGWDDIGNWSSVERYNSKDMGGNVRNQNSRMYKSNRNIVITKKKTLLNNVKDLIIVETDEYILISSKDKEQEIREAVGLI